MTTRRVVLSDLPLPEKERFYEFLVANKVEFVTEQEGVTYAAMIRVVPPEPPTTRITGKVRQAAPQNSNSIKSKLIRGATIDGTIGVPKQDPGTSLKAAQSVLRRRYSRFCNLLPTLMQAPKALRRVSLEHFADEVYEARYEKDSLYIKNENTSEGASKLPQTFPDFVYEFAAKRYGLKALVSANCWGMVSSVELLRGGHSGIDLYGKFLEETYDATDLLFFLFARSAVDRVMAPAQIGEVTDESIKVQKLKSYKSGPINLEAKQVYQVVKMSIDSKRQELRDTIIKRLDSIMATVELGPNRKAATLGADQLLAVATEEYHNSRDLGQDFDEASPSSPIKAGLPGGAMLKNDGEVEELTPEIRKEVRQVTARLVASLTASGERDVNTQEVYDWALQVTLRRHKIGDFLEQETDQVKFAMDIKEMGGAARGLKEQAGDQKQLVAGNVLNLSPDDFETNLEENVRQLLLNATQELVTDAVGALPHKIWRDEKVANSMKSALISEFAPAADILMESIVGKDYPRWLDTLKIDGEGTSKHREQFEKLHNDFQEVLSSDISASMVQGICRTVVGVTELQDLVRGKAIELSETGGREKRIGESSSEDEEDNLQGTAKFGDDV